MAVIETDIGAIIANGTVVVTYDDRVTVGGVLTAATTIETDVRGRAASDASTGMVRAVSVVGNRSEQMMTWGRRNTFPLQLQSAVSQSYLIPSLLDTKKKILVGTNSKALCFGYERFVWENDKQVVKRDRYPLPLEIKQLLARSGGHRFWLEIAAEWCDNGNVIVELVRQTAAKSADNLSIIQMRAQKARFWRKSVQNNMGITPFAFFRGDAWQLSSAHQVNFETRTTNLYPNVEADKNFLYWTGDPQFYANDYYYDVVYTGGLPWSALSDGTPIFHDAQRKRGAFPCAHIRMRKGMFLNPNYHTTHDAKLKAQYLAEEKAERSKWLAAANAAITGIDKAGSIIWNEEEFTKGIEKRMPDIEIVPLQLNGNDEAMLRVHQISEAATIASTQIPAPLACIETTANGEIKSSYAEALRMVQAVHCPTPREILLEPLYLAMEMNGWNEKYAYQSHPSAPELVGFVEPTPVFWFQDMEITDLHQTANVKKQ